MQLTDRAATLAQNGHPVDKIELLVLGGTWSSYPHVYQDESVRGLSSLPISPPSLPPISPHQEEFVRDLFYAANTFWQREKRPRCVTLNERR